MSTSENWISNEAKYEISNTGNLVNHEKKSNNQAKFKIWKCKYSCGKIFTQEKYMNTHILVMHENIRTLSCKKCSMHFSTQSRLKNHMFCHSSVKHLICLVCMSKRTKELSCMRHHLLNKHGIGIKHSLFRETYYKMSLKEIAHEEKNKKKRIKWGLEQEDCILNLKKNIFNLCELQEKLLIKAELICRKLKNISDGKEKEKQIRTKAKEQGVPNAHMQSLISNTEIIIKKPEKILTAENGMKLVKLPNGQFKKVSTTLS